MTEIIHIATHSPEIPEDPTKWIDAIQRLLHFVFGERIPTPITRCLGWALLAGLVLLAIWGLLYLLSKICNLWKAQFQPLFYDAKEKRKRELLRRFADHVDSEIRRLSSFEQWNDHRFAELEAEVESEGLRSGLLPFITHRRGIRRERTLSRALASSAERLILLEGAPGSGKSVALRHLAQAMARRAANSHRSDPLIPIYVNLKDFEIDSVEPPTTEAVRDLVMRSVNRVNDRDIDSFLDEFFDEGMKRGTWLFLFDSFDEIPAVLSSVEGDDVVNSYARVIADFLGGMNRCRGIIASREFRGPGQLGWPTFRILALSRTRQLELLKKAALPSDIHGRLLGNLQHASTEVQEMAANPMFLGILVEYVRTVRDFPDTAHNVFEEYVTTRLDRDAHRILLRFGLQNSDLRVTAEQVAFCMSAESTIGLSPSRDKITASMQDQRFDVTRLTQRLDAIEYIKLARPSLVGGLHESATFTFSHRRFQEYFATCIVLREPSRISSSRLLSDGRWRETAVVLCQTRPLNELRAILAEAEQQLHQMCGNLCPPRVWPRNALHLLGLLQDGFAARAALIPSNISGYIDRIVLHASRSASGVDQKWALEVAGCVTQNTLVGLLREAISTGSTWLGQVAYNQASHLQHLPVDVTHWIRRSLIDSARTGRLLRERYSTVTFLKRLPQPQELSSVARLLLWAPFIDLTLLIVLWLCLASRNASHPIRALAAILVPVVVFPFAVLWCPLHKIFPFSTVRTTKYKTMLDVQLMMLVFLSRTMAFSFGFYLFPTADRFIRHRLGEPEPSSLSASSLWSVPRLTPFAHPLLAALAIYFLLWGPNAVWSASCGDFTSVPWWPLQPLRPILHFTRSTKARINKLSDFMSKNKLVLGMLIFSFLIGPLFARVLRKFDHIVTPIMSSISVLVVFIVLSRLLLDCLQLYKWRRRTNKTTTVKELVEQTSKIFTDFIRASLVRRVRTGGQLTLQDQEDLLEQVVGYVWQKATRTQTSSNAVTDEADLIDKSDLSQRFGFQIKFKGWGRSTADEMCKLLEQVRLARTQR